MDEQRASNKARHQAQVQRLEQELSEARELHLEQQVQAQKEIARLQEQLAKRGATATAAAPSTLDASPASTSGHAQVGGDVAQVEEGGGSTVPAVSRQEDENDQLLLAALSLDVAVDDAGAAHPAPESPNDTFNVSVLSPLFLPQPQQQGPWSEDGGDVDGVFHHGVLDHSMLLASAQDVSAQQQTMEQTMLISQLQDENQDYATWVQQSQLAHGAELDEVCQRLNAEHEHALGTLRQELLNETAASEARAKTGRFQLEEELTAVKQQFIQICGEKQACEKRVIDLEFKLKRIEEAHNIECTSLRNQIGTLKAGREFARDEHNRAVAALKKEHTVSADEVTAAHAQALKAAVQAAAVAPRAEPRTCKHQFVQATAPMRTAATSTHASEALVGPRNDVAAAREETARAKEAVANLQREAKLQAEAMDQARGGFAAQLAAQASEASRLHAEGCAQLAAAQAEHTAAVQQVQKDEAQAVHEARQLQAEAEERAARLEQEAATAQQEHRARAGDDKEAKRTSLAALRDRYRTGIKELLHDIDVHLTQARKDSAHRFQMALKRTVQETGKRINTQYMGALQTLLEFVVEQCGEATAQALATRVFEEQGFSARLTPGQGQARPQKAARGVGAGPGPDEHVPLLETSNLMTPDPSPSPKSSPSSHDHAHALAQPQQNLAAATA